MIKGLENLECLTTTEALKRGLVPRGEPIIAKTSSPDLTTRREKVFAFVNPSFVNGDEVAYSKGLPVTQKVQGSGYYIYFPIQFFVRS